MYVSKKVCLWMLISAIIVCIDAFFVINRPETLKGGKYYQYFSLYELYTKYDTLYQMNDDKFVLIQSYLNICEAILTIFGLMVAFSSCKIKKLIGGLVCLVINTMILWKTVIFIWYDSYWTI